MEQSESLACLGWAGQGTNSLISELGKGGQRGRVLTMAPVPVSLLACSSKSVELEDADAILKDLEEAGGDTWGFWRFR